MSMPRPAPYPVVQQGLFDWEDGMDHSFATSDRYGPSSWGRPRTPEITSLHVCDLKARARAIAAVFDQFETLPRPRPAAPTVHLAGIP